MSLRALLTAAMIALGALALATAGVLVLVTARQERVTLELKDAVESVRLVEEIELDLLMHERDASRTSRMNLESDLRRKLAQVQPFLVDEEDEQALFRAAKGEIEAYLNAARASPSTPPLVELERAFAATDALSDEIVDDSIAARDGADRWSIASRFVGLAVCVLLAIAIAWIVSWLRRSAFAPVFAFGDAIERYGRGERAARASLDGPAEVALMARRFNEMADALDAQRQVRLQSLAAIAHDLRNPIAALALATDVVRGDRPLPSEERLRRTLAMVRKQTERLNRMVEDLLDAASIEAGRLRLVVEPRDLREIAREVVELFRSASDRHEIVLDAPDPVSVACDGARIAQVVTNLMSNAIKYAPGGGVVRVRVWRDETHASLSVSDPGVGIPPEDRAHVFEPFRRSATSADEFPGVGLGLSVVQKIVVGHGGSIDVDSEVGRGSTFTVRLPMGDARAMAS